MMGTPPAEQQHLLRPVFNIVASISRQRMEEDMNYQVGDKVSHPGHGACVVKGICDKEFGENVITYYELASVVENQTAIFVPVGRAEKLGLRRLITADEADLLLDALDRMEVTWITDRNQRQKEFESLFNDNEKSALLDSMSALCAIVSHRCEKPLGSYEKNMLQVIQNKALSEIALAKGISLDDAIARAESIILANMPAANVS